MMSKIFVKSPGFIFGLLAALLFGASTPVSKILLHQIHPWLLAGLLYLGSGMGLLVLSLFCSFWRSSKPESSLSKKDFPWLLVATFFGGMLAPVLLMQGLSRISASASSLLLNFETVFTVCIAWLVFKEYFNRRILGGVLLIISGAVILSWTSRLDLQNISGPLLVTGACFAWAVDNNATRMISGKNILQIATIKALVSGMTNTLLALFLGASLPAWYLVWRASVIGFFSYGLSLLCFILALRHVGAARTGALFGIAPFAGLVLSILFLSEPLTWHLSVAGILMAAGAWLHLREEMKM